MFSFRSHRRMKISTKAVVLLVFVFAIYPNLLPAQEKPATSSAQTAKPLSSVEVIFLDSKGDIAGKGGNSNNPVGEANKAGKAWHPLALQDAKLPKDRYGLIDWAKIIKDKLVDPKDTFEGNSDDNPPVDMDIIIPSKSTFVDDIIFPHWIHTFWHKCDDCHPKIFAPARGENKMSMREVVQGKWCGKCHNKVAFPTSDCTRCHVKVKKEG